MSKLIDLHLHLKALEAKERLLYSELDDIGERKASVEREILDEGVNEPTDDEILTTCLEAIRAKWPHWGAGVTSMAHGCLINVRPDAYMPEWAPRALGENS